MQEFEIEFEIKPSEFEIDISNVIRELTPPLIDLEVEPTNEKQVFKHEGEYGYDEVIVNPISDEYVIPTGTLDITENGEHDISQYQKASVNVGAPSKGLIIKAYDSDGYPTDVELVGMTTVPDYTFASYNQEYINLLTKKLVNISLPNNVTSTGRYACYYCSNLESIELPDSITSIGYYSFGYCTKLPLTKLPDNLTSIADRAFIDCRNLAITSLPSGVNRLYDRTFQNCTSLTELTIKGDIISLSGYVFNGCTNLAKVVLPNVTKVPTLNTSTFNNTPIANGTGYIYFPDALVEEAKGKTNWSAIASQIKGVSEL